MVAFCQMTSWEATGQVEVRIHYAGGAFGQGMVVEAGLWDLDLA